MDKKLSPGKVVISTGVFVIFVLILIALGYWDKIFPAPLGIKDEWGHFPTKPIVELLGDGRDLRLLEDFCYIDPNKKVWIAPKNSTINGASIPQIFWSLTGGPLEGQYRNASIIHDVGCDRMTENWEDVHLMFYEACRCGGVPDNKAKLLYAAVYHFGPRWELKTVKEVKVFGAAPGDQREVSVSRTVSERLPTPKPPDKATAEKIEGLIKNGNLSLEDLKKLDLKGF